MLTIDFIGLLFTACITGLRYPHHMLLATLIHELGRICMILFLGGQVEGVLAAGTFGATVASKLDSAVQGGLVLFSGPLANYMASSLLHGVAAERTSSLLNPFVPVKHPFAVVNLRFAVVSTVISLWNFFSR